VGSMKRSRGRSGRIMNLDMKTSIRGVFVRNARESLRLPGLMATAEMLRSLGSLQSFSQAQSMLNKGWGLQLTFSRYRFSAYIHMTTANFETAYL